MAVAHLGPNEPNEYERAWRAAAGRPAHELDRATYVRSQQWAEKLRTEEALTQARAELAALPAIRSASQEFAYKQLAASSAVWEQQLQAPHRFFYSQETAVRYAKEYTLSVSRAWRAGVVDETRSRELAAQDKAFAQTFKQHQRTTPPPADELPAADSNTTLTQDAPPASESQGTPDTAAETPALPHERAREYVAEVAPEMPAPRIQPPHVQRGGAEKNVARVLRALKLDAHVMQGEDFYAKVRNPPYLALTIERHREQPLDRLYLTHYYEHNGDLVPDGEMVFAVGESGLLKLVKTAPAVGPGGEIRGLDRSFGALFARNLRAQGFGQGEVFRLERDGEDLLAEYRAARGLSPQTEPDARTDNPESATPAAEITPSEPAAAPATVAPEPAAPEPEAAPRKPDNFRLTDDELHNVGLKTKFKQNIAALELLQQLQAEQRDATPDEMPTLAGFSGWGGLKPAFAAAYGAAQSNPNGWEKEHEQLRSLLHSEEYYAARQSSENAHYTSPQFARQMWAMAQRLGFDGGRVLEPAAGVGNILAVQPDALRGTTHLTAVEKDPLTAQLATQLYPRAQVHAASFERAPVPDNHFDLVLSNFPFGSFSVADPRYDALRPSIHDYFVLKSLDKVRPGGLVIALTSRYTMDKLGPEMRQRLAQQADLVAAFRLPDNTFQKNAHTAVVTDLLILKKRAPGATPDPRLVPTEDWRATTPQDLPDKDNGLSTHAVNDYFLKNPAHVWGELRGDGSMNYRHDLTVKDDGQFWQRVATALAALPQGVYEPRENAPAPPAQPADNLWADVATRKRGNYLVRDGQAYQITAEGALVTLERAPADLARLEQLTALRDTVRDLYAADLAGASAAAEALRATLNEQYDAFAAQHGPLKRRSNIGLLKGDPDEYLVAALEDYDPHTGAAHKADVFFESTITGYVRPTHAGNLSEAVAVSLNEEGRLNLERIGALLNTTAQEVTAQFVAANLAYENPATDAWETADDYLSGNVRAKLDRAREAAGISAENESRYTRNVRALAAVQPPDLDYVDIEAVLGAPWLPPTDVKDFVLHLTQAERDAVTVEYSAATAQWRVSWAGNAAAKRARQKDSVNKVWGTPDADAVKIVQAALDGKPLLISRQEGDKQVVDRAATDAANNKMLEIKQEFKDWVWSPPERRQRLHRIYNDTFNNTVPRRYDGSHLTLPGSNPAIQLRPHQKDAVWRAMQEPSTYFAHEVGTGKTIALGAALMEKKRLGQLRKPVLGVMKANIRQVTHEIQTLYPTARIFSGDGQFDAHDRRGTIAAIGHGNWDLVILTYEQLDKIPFHPETKRAYIGREVAELESTIAAALAAHGKRSKLVSRLNQRSLQLDTQLQRLLNQPQDDVLTFEETGLDYVAVDEAHNFKNLPIYTTMAGIKGLPTARAERATNMHLRAEYLRAKFGQPRLLLASGTPVTNTVAELYNVMRFTQPQELKARGIDNFDAFAKTYTETVSRMEATVTGEYQPQTRLAKFINVPELRALAGLTLDVVKAADAGIARPPAQHFVVAVPPSPEQLAFRGTLRARAEAIRRKLVEPWQDNYLSVMNDGRLMSLDLRLVDEAAADHPNSKVNLLVANVLRLAQEKPGATQLVFSDLGVNPSERTGHAIYYDLERKLIDGGLPRERIANFARLTDKQRQETIEKLNSGEILVAIGSTQKLGTGVNAQQFIVAAHNLDVPWLPSSVEQRRGRAVRQGNLFAELGESITLYNYVTKGTFDEIGWNTIERKEGFINQVVTNTLNGQRHFEEPDAEEMSAAQIAAVASGNPDVLRRLELSEETTRLARMAQRHRQMQFELQDRIPQLATAVSERAAQAARWRTDSEYYRQQRQTLGWSDDAPDENLWTQAFRESLSEATPGRLFVPGDEARAPRTAIETPSHEERKITRLADKSQRPDPHRQKCGGQRPRAATVHRAARCPGNHRRVSGL